MLKYEINKNRMSDDSVTVPCTRYEENDYDGIDDTKRLMLCYLDEVFTLYEGETVRCYYSHTYTDSNGNPYETSMFKELKIDGVNRERNVFTVVADKYRKLFPNIGIIGVPMMYKNSDGDIITETEYNNMDTVRKEGYYTCLNCDAPLMITLVFDTPHNLADIGTGSTIFFKYKDENLMEKMFSADVTVLNERSVEFYYTPQIGSIIGLDNTEYHTFDATNISVFAEDFFFPPLYYSDITFSMSVYRYSTSVSIPISINLSTDLNHDTDISENFTSVEIRKSIPPIIEWEKDIYYPVYKNNDGTFDYIRKINFNFHFRERDRDNLGIIAGGLWNDNGKIDGQSDLLSKIGFTNTDVKYQKNKLKRSFARISFFDDISQNVQNLLSSSTIFINSGELYSKFVKFSLPNKSNDTYPYKYEDSDTKSLTDKINVNTEPFWALNNENIDIETKEKFRLSTRLSVMDKYSSNNSSEGFYQYFYKKENAGYTIEDIYLKVEFNHAGLGRILPMMMPYWKEEGEKKGKIKTFSEILDDWQWENGGYGYLEYYDYSYIRFKCCFNKELNSHIYYMDSDFYSYGNTQSIDYNAQTHTLNINLYEANMALK